jgi:hypothetical protein
MIKMPEDKEICRPIMTKCDRLIQAFNRGVWNADEFFFNLMITLVQSVIDDLKYRDCWSTCLDQLPKDVLRAFDAWLQREVAALDYMPAPNPFMADTRDPNLVAIKRRELRPHFVELHDLVRQ